jgi:hypothetical protein
MTNKIIVYFLLGFSIFFLLFSYRQHITKFGQYVYMLANPSVLTPTPSPIRVHIKQAFTSTEINTFLNRPAKDTAPVYQATVKFPQDGTLELVGRFSSEQLIRFFYQNDSGTIPPLLNTLFKLLPSVSFVDLRCQFAIINDQISVQTERLTLSKINFNRPEIQPNQVVGRFLAEGLYRYTQGQFTSLTIKDGKLFMDAQIPQNSPFFNHFLQHSP